MPWLCGSPEMGHRVWANEADRPFPHVFIVHCASMYAFMYNEQPIIILVCACRLLMSVMNPKSQDDATAGHTGSSTPRPRRKRNLSRLVNGFLNSSIELCGAL